MRTLRDRISTHAAKFEKYEENEAALAGIFSKEAIANKARFTALVQQVVKPAFNEFKMALREVGRDAVIVASAPEMTVQSIGLSLCHRYLSFGVGKTLKLVNPKEDIAKTPNTKFYELVQADGGITVRQRADSKIGTIVTQVAYTDICAKFLENELASFFERAFPTPG